MKTPQPGTRRNFLTVTGLGTAAALAASSGSFAPQAAAEEHTPSKPEQRPLRLALASYTLRKFDLDQTLAMTTRLGLEAICLKDFHLPLDASADQIAETAARREYGSIWVTIAIAIIFKLIEWWFKRRWADPSFVIADDWQDGEPGSDPSLDVTHVTESHSDAGDFD